MSRDGRTAVVLALCMFGVYSANGREIASYDSQPTKYAARELLLRGTLSLNYVVGKTPELANRAGFVQTRSGRIRSAYSPVPAILAAGITWPFWKAGLIDIRAVHAPGLMAAVTSALLVALAVAFAFLIARQQLSSERSLLLAIGFGAGTGLWSTASQTLWQHETAIFGLTLAVLALARGAALSAPRDGTAVRPAPLPWKVFAAAGLALGLAAGARLQLAPAVVVLLVGTFVIFGLRACAVASAAAAVILIPVLIVNYQWFGTIVGAAPLLELRHSSVHRTSSTFVFGIEGFAGLLVSPNRGLFVFSPVVIVALLGIPGIVRGGARSMAAWVCLAGAAQYTLYALYSVWWGGHTYGPRYLLDVLPLLLPAAILGMTIMKGPVRTTLGTAALAWSVAVAAIGAVNHPQGRWNSEPIDVDREHSRLWDWSDLQVVRTWHAGPSLQNYTLFTADAIRVTEP